MSKPRYKWWGYIKAVFREYPSIKDEEVTGVALREKEAVQAAIKQTEHMRDGQSRLVVVDMVLWKRTRTLAGAALQVPCSERTARRYQAEFVKMVAKEFGLMD